jgi:uncharacterized protein YjeT (DUF2065 family)
MSDVWLAALALMLVIEGILPFTAPRIWRETFRQLITLTDGQLRFAGLPVDGDRARRPLLRHMTRRWLLPEHIEDVLPAEARAMERLRRAILDLFESHGYELVAPPLLEYTDSLLSGIGKDLDLATFKLVDQLSGRMMGVRADHTPRSRASTRTC